MAQEGLLFLYMSSNIKHQNCHKSFLLHCVLLDRQAVLYKIPHRKCSYSLLLAMIFIDFIQCCCLLLYGCGSNVLRYLFCLSHASDIRAWEKQNKYPIDNQCLTSELPLPCRLKCLFTTLLVSSGQRERLYR